MRKFFDIYEETSEVIKEIMDYKWIESEKAGNDIGTDRATSEWISKHYDEWFRYNSSKFIKECK